MFFSSLESLTTLIGTYIILLLCCTTAKQIIFDEYNVEIVPNENYNYLSFQSPKRNKISFHALHLRLIIIYLGYFTPNQQLKIFKLH